MLYPYPQNKALLCRKQALIDQVFIADNQAMVDKTTPANEELARKIAAAINAVKKDIKAAEIAAACGVKPQAVTGWKKTGRIGKETLSKLADFLGLPLSHFIGTGGEPKPERKPLKMIDEVEDAPTPMGRQRYLPVVGVVQAGPDGLLTIDDYPVGFGDGAVPYWAKCENAYALRVRGESMSPRYLPGEFVAVDPCFEVQPSQEVIVLKRDGTRMIKRLMWMRDGQAAFESINKDYKNIILEMEEIDGMHRVLGIVPSFAFRANT